LSLLEVERASGETASGSVLNKLSTHRWVDVIICHTGSRASRWFAIVDVSACFHVAASSGNVRIAYQVVGQGPLDLVFVPASS
jgi:hypothetical protein